MPRQSAWFDSQIRRSTRLSPAEARRVPCRSPPPRALQLARRPPTLPSDKSCIAPRRRVLRRPRSSFPGGTRCSRRRRSRRTSPSRRRPSELASPHRSGTAYDPHHAGSQPYPPLHRWSRYHKRRAGLGRSQRIPSRGATDSFGGPQTKLSVAPMRCSSRFVWNGCRSRA